MKHDEFKRKIYGVITSLTWMLLFIGGMFISPLIIMTIGVYFDIDFIIDSIYAMNDFVTIIGTSAITESILELAEDCAVFIHMTMCLGYVPVIVAMFICKNKNGGYNKIKINEIKNIFKWISVSMTVSCILDFIMQICCKIPCLLQQSSILSSINILSTSGLPWLALLTIGILAPIVEEITFRYGIQKNITERFNHVIGIIASSVIFGVTHLNLFQGIFATLMGIVLGYVYYKTNNLWYTIIIHIINNFACVLITIYELNSIVISITIPVISAVIYCIIKYFNKHTI